MAKVCYNCMKRYVKEYLMTGKTVSCHSECKDYLDEVKEEEAKKEKIRRKKRLDNDYNKVRGK